MVSTCKSLTYLDTRPVTEKERLGVEAWSVGGSAAERQFHEEWARKEQEKMHQGIINLMK